MSIARLVCSALICAWMALPPLAAADATDAMRPLFAAHRTLAVRIEVPLRDVMQQRDDEEYRDGTFTYTDAGTQHTLDLKLRARGHYRRQDDVCRFAPLRLNFRKSQLDGTLFAGQDKLKLVTHCQSSRSVYEQYLLKEYLSYRILELLTDASFRVRLLRVQWVDSERPEDVLERYAFLIEDDDHLAERLGSRVAEIPYTGAATLVPQQSALVAVFEYLIGNTDFSLLRGPAEDTCCHNAVLIEQAGGRYLPVPYDFDFSGLVSTPYAKPSPKMSIRNVRTRLYRGHCEVNDQLPQVLQVIRERRHDIAELIATQDGLSSSMRKRAALYIDDFFKAISSPSRVERNLVKRCI
ncbi:MAG TPA: hypothetical protein VFE85_00390 [Woeseiaceae bacterium]|nr:hypothetical protein [Woeseiaceae bacterium]